MMNQFYQSFHTDEAGRYGRVVSVKKYFFALAVMLLTSFSMTVMAQDVTLTGTVSGTDGTTLPGVTVQVKGTNKGTQTDVNGKFTLAGVPKTSTIVFSFVGMQSQEVAVGNKSVIDVVLKDDSKTLEEVVVVGYGTQKRKEISGTVTTISSRDFNSGVVTNPLQAAQGKVAGLVITQSSGDPNAQPTVRLRGTGSLTAGSEPLYVIDGVIGAPIANVAPEDIATIDVLRDASSAAIYGSRGANGVIIINTKRGKSGATAVDYSGWVGMETISQKPDLMNAAQFREAATKYNQPFTDNGANTDWLKVITRTATSQNHNLGVSGGSENFSYRASVGYLDQVGTLLGSSKNRVNARLNLDSKGLDGKLAIKFNLSASQAVGNIPQNIALGLAQNMRPTDPVYNADGTYFQIPGTFANYNPLAVVKGRTQEEKLNDMLGNLQLGYTIADGLVFNLNGTIRTQSKDVSFFQNSTAGIIFGGLNTTGNVAERTAENVLDKQLEALLSYNKKMGASTLGLLGGYTYQDVTTDGLGAANYNFLTDNLGANNLGGGLGTISNPHLVGSYKNEYKLVSFLARVQYGYMDKYFATINARYDGSTKFGANNKWGFFPSVSVGWALSKEDFLKDVTALDNLKLRISYGRTGNSEGIAPNLSQSFYGPGSAYPTPSNSFFPSYGITSNANPNLKWEVNENYGAGLDFAFWKNRLTGSIDYYTRKTNDLLYNVPVDQTVNFYPTTLLNVGSMQNRGVELTLDYQWIDTKTFTWHTIFAGSFNRNKLLSLNGSSNIPLQVGLGNFLRGTSSVAFSFLTPGQPVGVFYGAVVDHIEGGKYVFKDLNNDGKIEPSGADRQILGDPNPYFVGSLTNQFTYGNFDLSFQLTSNMGNKIINTPNLLIGRQDGRIAESNALVSALTSPINDQTTIPMSYYVESGNFVRLNNASIGYTLPITKGVLHRAKIYVAGNNLLLFTSYKGVDPEVSQALQVQGQGSFGGLNDKPVTAPGVDVRETYYKTRAFTAGINLTF